MTSNLGSEYILEGRENAKELVYEELRHEFRPELINRIDEIIVFNSLQKDSVGLILDKILKEISNRLGEKQLKLELSDKAREKVIEESFDPQFGARPIKRYVTQHIETLIAHKLIEADLKPGNTLYIDVVNDSFTISIH